MTETLCLTKLTFTNSEDTHTKSRILRQGSLTWPSHTLFKVILTPAGTENSELQKIDVSKFPSTYAESSQTCAWPCGYPRFSQLSCSSVLSNHLCIELRGCKTAMWQHDLHGDLETKAGFAFILGKIH